MNLKGGEFEWRIEIRLFGLALLTEAHFLSTIWAHTVNVACMG